MPFDPIFPLSRATAARLHLDVVDEFDKHRNLVGWSFAPGGLGDHPALAYYHYVPDAPRDKPYKDDYATKYAQAMARRFNAAGPWHEACTVASARLAATVCGWKAQGRLVAGIRATTATRLLVGMGYKNALEVGLTFHHPGGFPYLPGSSVKGLCRAWAEMVEENVDKETVKRIFGTATKNEKEEAGAMEAGTVCFLDALPVQFPKLDVDLMNPHFGDYYQDQKNETAPGDWLNPVVIPFLAISPGQAFRFFLVGRTAEAAEDVEEARGWLEKALQELGAGGKTAAGYGYFTDVVPDP